MCSYLVYQTLNIILSVLISDRGDQLLVTYVPVEFAK